ncbi:MAG: hypothetical protein Q7S74_00545 [Nanoarchaeota archaeon]|nr:hypothetical protein [Nanoarchaeota archaeon]
MIKWVLLVVGILMMLKGSVVHFYRGPTIKLADKMINEVKKHKKYKMINFFALLDVLIGLILIWIAATYS